MRVILAVETGDMAGRKLWLNCDGMTTVGRTELADFVVPDDDLMSSIHFSLQCHDSKCHLRDLNSTNGTFVNRRRITAADLGDGDQVVAGTTSFSVKIEATQVVAVPRSITTENRSVAGTDDRNQVKRTASSLPNVSPSENFQTAEFQAAFRSMANRPITDDKETKPTSIAAESSVHSTGQRESAVTQIVLRFSDNVGERRAWLRPGQSIIVGRSDGADVSLEGVSDLEDFHFAVDCHWSQSRLRDLDSELGTYLNGVPVAEAIVYDGDVIQAGKTKFLISIQGGAVAPETRNVEPRILTRSTRPRIPLPTTATSPFTVTQSRCTSGLTRFLISGSDFSITDLIRQFVESFSLYLLVDQQRLSSPTLTDSFDCEPIIANLTGPVARLCSPLLCSSQELSRLLGFVEKHCEGGGVMCLFSSSDRGDLLKRLQHLAAYSEPKAKTRNIDSASILAIHHPRIMSALLQHSDSELLGDFADVCNIILLKGDETNTLELFSRSNVASIVSEFRTSADEL